MDIPFLSDPDETPKRLPPEREEFPENVRKGKFDYTSGDPAAFAAGLAELAADYPEQVKRRRAALNGETYEPPKPTPEESPKRFPKPTCDLSFMDTPEFAKGLDELAADYPELVKRQRAALKGEPYDPPKKENAPSGPKLNPDEAQKRVPPKREDFPQKVRKFHLKFPGPAEFAEDAATYGERVRRMRADLKPRTDMVLFSGGIAELPKDYPVDGKRGWWAVIRPPLLLALPVDDCWIIYPNPWK